MKLFKKLMVALSVLCLVGMLAACSNGNSNNGGSGGGGQTTVTGEWKVVYNGTAYAEDMTEEELQEGIELMQLETPADYTINESTKTVTLTDAGYAKVEAFEGALEGDEYSIVYNGEEIMTLPAIAVASMGALLEEGTDYTINESTKTITLTDEGFEKASVFFDEA